MKEWGWGADRGKKGWGGWGWKEGGERNEGVGVGGAGGAYNSDGNLPPTYEVWGKVICLQACVCPQGGCLLRGVSAPRCVCVPGGDPPPMATAAGGTHPTGMQFCSVKCLYLHSQISMWNTVYLDVTLYI